jgi:hypothetical protein
MEGLGVVTMKWRTFMRGPFGVDLLVWTFCLIDCLIDWLRINISSGWFLDSMIGSVF